MFLFKIEEYISRFTVLREACIGEEFPLYHLHYGTTRVVGCGLLQLPPHQPGTLQLSFVRINEVLKVRSLFYLRTYSCSLIEESSLKCFLHLTGIETRNPDIVE